MMMTSASITLCGNCAHDCTTGQYLSIAHQAVVFNVSMVGMRLLSRGQLVISNVDLPVHMCETTRQQVAFLLHGGHRVPSVHHSVTGANKPPARHVMLFI